MGNLMYFSSQTKLIPLILVSKFIGHFLGVFWVGETNLCLSPIHYEGIIKTLNCATGGAIFHSLRNQENNVCAYPFQYPYNNFVIVYFNSAILTWNHIFLIEFLGNFNLCILIGNYLFCHPELIHFSFGSHTFIYSLEIISYSSQSMCLL